MTKQSDPGGAASRVSASTSSHRRLRDGACVAWILLLAGCVNQTRSELPQDLAFGSCNKCSIEVEDIWTSFSDDPNLTDLYEVLELGDEILTVGRMDGHRILRHDLKGLRPSIATGRRGEGPGEFKDVVAGSLDWSHDTIILAQANRVNYLDRQLIYKRSFVPPVPVRTRGLVAIDDHTFIVASEHPGHPSRVRPGTQYLLHEVSNQGTLLDSFAPIDDSVRVLWLSVHAASDPYLVWSLVSMANGFAATLWNVQSKTSVRTITVTPSWWFTSNATPMELERNPKAFPSDTRAIDLRQDGDILWVVLMHQDKDWATASLAEFRPDLWSDGVLVALNAATGDHLGLKVFDSALFGFSSDGHPFSYTVEADGQPRVRIMKASLIRDGS